MDYGRGNTVTPQAEPQLVARPLLPQPPLLAKRIKLGALRFGQIHDLARVDDVVCGTSWSRRSRVTVPPLRSKP
jgi:hypothetical protein